LRGVRLLIAEGITDQEAIELLSAAAETVNRMIAPEFLGVVSPNPRNF
jgi:succinyl-CoA synthetase alpha subunit